MDLTFARKIAGKLGMDKAIAYSSGARIVGGVTGILTVFFISTFLTGIEQGFYFTFGSILAMQVFFELGLTGIMTQFVAHESSHLILKNNKAEFEGDRRYRSRLASLIRFCVKWYFVLALVVFVFLIIVGYVFFNRYGEKHNNVEWQIPWLLICMATSMKLFQSPFNSIFMGMGKVKEVSEIGFWQQVIQPISIWIGLIIGIKLYVIGIGYLLSVALWQIYIQKSGMLRIIINLLKSHITEEVSYWKEIFPFQWKIALSWVSGYFSFQLFNPVLFATEGAIVAGQMGMTLTALNAIQALSMSWVNTKVPLYSKLIAIKEYDKLDNLFIKTLRQMTNVCLVMLVVFFFLVMILNITQLKMRGNVIAERFLPYLPMFLMAFPMYLQQYVYSWATYLRCHKQEPFLINSICGGFVSCLSIIFFGNLFGLYGVTISYCVVAIIFFPWGYWIYKTKKAEWHK